MLVISLGAFRLLLLIETALPYFLEMLKAYGFQYKEGVKTLSLNLPYYREYMGVGKVRQEEGYLLLDGEPEQKA